MTAAREDFDYASEVQAALHQGTSMRNHIFLFTILAMVAAGVFWADRAMVDEVTRGTGKVIPSTQLQVVQSLEGGIIKELLVREGDMVTQGQILLRIDDTGLSSSLGELRAQQRTLAAQIHRLQAEVDGADTVIFPPELIEEAPELADAERRLFEARREALESQLAIVRQQASQREQELTELKRQEVQYQSSLDLARQEMNIMAPLARSGVVPQTEMLQLRRQTNDLTGQLEATQLAIPRAESAIREARDRIEEQSLTFRSEAVRELNQRRAEAAVIDETLRAARDRVVRTDVRSPVDGIVNTINVTTVGGVTQPGQELMEIVPLDDTLLIEAEIRPSDVAFLSPGQEATVKLTAYDFSIYGGLTGIVSRISADTSVNEQTGDSFYRIIVQTEDTILGNANAPLPIIPGMVASVDILTGEKSILDYLLKPLVKARDEALRER
ncbi:MAG: HlyD family type I secretion periplasmic adaptor subunit [Inquilinaceae bacterium]